MNEEKARMIAFRIRDEFEDLLTERNIMIPSADRTGDPGEARLYGEECSHILEAIERILIEQADMSFSSEDVEDADHPARSLAIAICDEFEDLLDAKDITIPSPDREGRPEEARLYGDAYWQMEDIITDILMEEFGVAVEHESQRR